MRKRSETAETQRKHNKNGGVCVKCWKNVSRKKKNAEKAKKMRRRPNEIETFADSLKFPLLIMHGDNPNRSLLPPPLSMQIEIQLMMEKKMKGRERKICKAFN